MKAKYSPEICVVTTIHPTFDARVYARELLGLVDHGYSVAFVTPWEQSSESDPRHLWVRVPYTGRRSDRFLHGWRVFRAAIDQNAKAYHFHDLDFLPWAVLLKWIRGVPVVYDCHENYSEEILYNKPWIPRWLRPMLATLTRWVETCLAWALGQVIVTVPHLHGRFSGLGITTTLVQNFAKWSPRPDLNHERGLVCTGGLSVSYGVDVLLGVARILKEGGRGDIPLTLTNRFYTPAIEMNVKTIIHSEQLNIRIVPKVSPNCMEEVLCLGSIGLATETLSPEKLLALPTKLFEYMAFGLPVVVTPLPLSRAVVEESECGLVANSDQAKEVAEAVLRLLDDPILFKTCRENGFLAVQGRFNWDIEKSKLTQLFERLIGPPKARSPEEFPC